MSLLLLFFLHHVSESIKQMIKVSIMQHGEIMRMLLGKSPVSKIVMLGNSIKKVPIKKKDAMRIRKRLRFVVCLSLSSFALSFLEKSFSSFSVR